MKEHCFALKSTTTKTRKKGVKQKLQVYFALGTDSGLHHKVYFAPPQSSVMVN